MPTLPARVEANEYGVDILGNATAKGAEFAKLSDEAAMRSFLAQKNPALSTQDIYPGGHAFQNIIDNPNFRIFQRSTEDTGQGVAARSNYIGACDRWNHNNSGSDAVLTFVQSTDSPAISLSGYQGDKCLYTEVSTADAALAAGDYSQIYQSIESYRWWYVRQTPLRMSFWYKAGTTGGGTWNKVFSFCLNVSTSSPHRYIKEIPITGDNTWRQAVIDIPASGSWDEPNPTYGANSLGNVAASWILTHTHAGSSSTYVGTDGAWNTGNVFVGPTACNFVDNVTNYFRITDVRLHPKYDIVHWPTTTEWQDMQIAWRYYRQWPLGTTTGDSINSFQHGSGSMWNGGGWFFHFPPVQTYRGGGTTLGVTNGGNVALHAPGVYFGALTLGTLAGLSANRYGHEAVYAWQHTHTYNPGAGNFTAWPCWWTGSQPVMYYSCEI